MTDFTPGQAVSALVEAAAARLQKLARETQAQLSEETAAGGEPAFPEWISDVLTLVRYVGEAPLARNATLEEAAQAVEGGSFQHSEAPSARFARDAARAIRARKALIPKT